MERSNPGPRLGRPLGSGKEAQVFEYGSKAVKLYPSGGRKEAAFREAAILAGLEGTGLPVPAVWEVWRIDQRPGVVTPRGGWVADPTPSLNLGITHAPGG